MNKEICAIIVTYNSDRELFKVVHSIYNKVNSIFIIDNGSTDLCTLDILDKIKSKSKVVIKRNQNNKGIAYALNQGVKLALDTDCQWILTLDDDSIVEENMIESMLTYYENCSIIEKEKIAIIAPRHIEKSETVIYDKKQHENVNFEITSGNLVKRNIYEEKLFYDDFLFIDYVDYDFCFKVKKMGYNIMRLNNSILFHSLGNSKKYKLLNQVVTVTNHSPIRRFYMTRNRMILWKRYSENKKWVKSDKKKFINEYIKIILFESNKLQKTQQIIKGIWSSKKCIL